MLNVNDNLHISEEGLKFIANWEGCILFSYDDLCYPYRPAKKGDKIKGTLTIGIGHIENVYIGQTITEKEAWDLFRKDMANDYELRVKRYLKVPVSQTTFDSLCSRAYNVGNIINVANALNNGDNELAIQLMNKPNTSKGIVLAGLTRRRIAEREMLRKGLNEPKQESTKRDLELENAVSKIIKQGNVQLDFSAWKRNDRIKLNINNVPTLLCKLARVKLNEKPTQEQYNYAVNTLVHDEIISSREIWDEKKYNVNNVISLLKKYASKVK